MLGSDETPPSSIKELTADSGAYGTLTGVRLEWQASVDNESGLGRYEIFRNDETEPMDIALKTTFLDHTVKAGASYTYRVVPVNRLGLRGPESVIVVDATANAKLADNITLASQ